MMPIIHRLGCKTRIMPRLLHLFPERMHTFVEPFMGTGAITFTMAERAEYVIANDKDANIYNLYLVLRDRKEELYAALQMMPYHEQLWRTWKQQEESDPILKAVRFLLFSNCGLYGKPNTMTFRPDNQKAILLQRIEQTYLHMVAHVKFTCGDFREVFAKLSWRSPRDRNQSFCYCDPPYFETDHNYADDFTETDVRDLFALLQDSQMPFAISEFNHPLILQLAAQYHLHVTPVCERQTIKNRRTELLLTNYQPFLPSLFAYAQHQ